MKIVIRLFIFLLAISCSAPTKKEASISKDTSPSSTDSSRPNNLVVQYQTAPQDTTIPFLAAPGSLEKHISWLGDLYEKWIWYDTNGKNILVLSFDRLVVHEEEDVSSSNLYAKHYLIAKGSDKVTLLWEMHDFQKDCIFDLTSEFIISPLIVDSDKNGIFESYLVYKQSCRSDASPAEMKIIVHEGKKKYALRGLMVLKVNDYEDSLYSDDREPDLSNVQSKTQEGFAAWGRFENANDFNSSSPAILTTAIQLWKENRKEN